MIYYVRYSMRVGLATHSQLLNGLFLPIIPRKWEKERKKHSAEKDNDKKEETPAAGSQPPAENRAKETPKDKEGEKEEAPDIDYKKLYEEKCAELESVQKQNTRTEQPEVKTTSLDDIVRSFM